MKSICSVLILAAFTAGCESRKAEKASAIEVIASANPAIVAPSAAPVAQVAATPPQKVVRRPGEHEVLLATPEHRAVIENRHPEAAGFLTDEQLEERLFAMELKRGKDREAAEALDRMARGKWIFVSGPIVNPKADGFELPIRYTPRDPADPVGLTSQWINVKFTNVQGFDPAEYRAGEQIAVVAKYNGNREASPGFDLIFLDEWYPKGK